MRHPDDESAGALLDGGVDAELESGHEGFAALQAKALHRVEFGGHEGAPLVSPVQAGVHVDAFGLCRLAELDFLEFLANPIAYFAFLDMHELHANFVAVGFAVGLDEVAKHPLGLAVLDGFGAVALGNHELAVHVRLGEAILGRVHQVKKLLVRELELFSEAGTISVVLLQLEGVDVSHQVTVGHVRAQQHLQSDGFVRLSATICAATGTATSGLESGEDLGDVSDCGLGAERGRRVEGALSASEIRVPRSVDGRGVLLPLRVHEVDVVGVLAAHKVVFVAEAAHGLVEDGLRGGGQAGARSQQQACLLHS